MNKGVGMNKLQRRGERQHGIMVIPEGLGSGNGQNRTNAFTSTQQAIPHRLVQALRVTRGRRNAPLQKLINSLALLVQIGLNVHKGANRRCGRLEQIVGDPIKRIFRVSNCANKYGGMRPVDDPTDFSSLFSPEPLSILFHHEHSKSRRRMGTLVIGNRTRNVRGVS